MGNALRLWIRQATRQTALTAFLVLSLAISLGWRRLCAISQQRCAVAQSSVSRTPVTWCRSTARDADGQPRWLSWRELESMTQSRIEPFDSVAGYTAADFNALSEPGLPPEPLSATVVSPDFFARSAFASALGGLPRSTPMVRAAIASFC